PDGEKVAGGRMRYLQESGGVRRHPRPSHGRGAGGEGSGAEISLATDPTRTRILSPPRRRGAKIPRERRERLFACHRSTTHPPGRIFLCLSPALGSDYAHRVSQNTKRPE